MAINLTKIKGSVRPIRNRVIVSDMNFGETTTKGGIIITSDDGKDRGVKPRWAKVVAKGPENNDEYAVGDWILIEHGRWTRGYDVEDETGTVTTLRTVEAESVLAMSTEQPDEILFGGVDGVSKPTIEDFK